MKRELLVSFLLLHFVVAGQTKPNILYILADDLGNQVLLKKKNNLTKIATAINYFDLDELALNFANSLNLTLRLRRRPLAEPVRAGPGPPPPVRQRHRPGQPLRAVRVQPVQGRAANREVPHHHGHAGDCIAVEYNY